MFVPIQRSICSVKAMALVTGLVLLTSLPAHARLYKWVDSEGNVIYSQTPPPQEAQSGHVELNKRGLTLREVEAPLSEQERAEREAREKEKARSAALLALEAQKDESLLRSYPSIRAFDQARDNRLETLDQKVRYLDSRRSDSENKLLRNSDRMANFRRKKLKIPAQLVSEKLALDLEVADLRQRLSTAQAERDGVAASFAEDRERYLRLTAERKRLYSGS